MTLKHKKIKGISLISYWIAIKYVRKPLHVYIILYYLCVKSQGECPDDRCVI